MQRKILHFDLDAFFCSVEELRDPSLCGKPFAVGGQPETRGVVASCSYPARRFGIHSAMPMSQAVRRCPHLTIVPANHKAYSETSRKVMDRLRALTPLVEQLSVDEAFLDAKALPSSAEEIARQLQQTIIAELGLACSLGVASNKLVAKIANNIGKAASKSASEGATPNAIQVIPPGSEAAFLAPLPCEELWGVGPKTAERLAKLQLHTIGDIAAMPTDEMARRFGKNGLALSSHAKGIDTRQVETERESKSVSQEITYSKDVYLEDKLLQTLRDLSIGVGDSLRRKELNGKTVQLKIRWPDFTTLTRQVTLERPTSDGEEIHNAALMLFQRIWARGQGVRLLGVGVSGFERQARQMSLWEIKDEIEQEAQEAIEESKRTDKERRLDEAIGQLRQRFGDQIVLRASEWE